MDGFIRKHKPKQRSASKKLTTLKDYVDADADIASIKYAESFSFVRVSNPRKLSKRNSVGLIAFSSSAYTNPKVWQRT